MTQINRSTGRARPVRCRGKESAYPAISAPVPAAPAPAPAPVPAAPAPAPVPAAPAPAPVPA